MRPVCPAANDWIFPPAQALVTAVTKYKEKKFLEFVASCIYPIATILAVSQES